jgi:hypothetical protein
MKSQAPIGSLRDDSRTPTPSNCYPDGRSHPREWDSAKLKDASDKVLAAARFCKMGHRPGALKFTSWGIPIHEVENSSKLWGLHLL